MLAVVTGDGAVRGLALDNVTIRGDELRGHHTKRAEALGDNVRLNVTVVVFRGPHEATVALDGLSNHVINETVLVPDSELLELGLVLSIVELLEDVLELSIVRLENGILGAHVQRQLLADGDAEARVGEADDRLSRVVHGKRHTTVLGVLKHLVRLLLVARVIGLVSDGELATVRHGEVHAAVLVTERVAANADGLGPAGDRARNALEDNGLAENGATNYVTDSTVGREPHFLEVEFLHTRLVGRDGGALDTDLELLDSLCSLSGHLVFSGITVLNTEVIILEVNVEVREDQLVSVSTHVLADDLPDDTLVSKSRTVISSPSSSTTGLSTLIFWNGILVENVRLIEREVVPNRELDDVTARRAKDDVADTKGSM